MNIHRFAFQSVFAYSIDQSFAPNALRFSSYVPVIGQMVSAVVLSLTLIFNDSKNEKDQASNRAIKARCIITVLGAGPLLIPVDIFATIMNCQKSVFSHYQKS